MTPKCITNQREMTMTKHRFRSYNAQKRTPSTELRNCMKTRSVLSFPCCIAQETNFKIIQNYREFLPNARRDSGQFEVYLIHQNAFWMFHALLARRLTFEPPATPPQVRIPGDAGTAMRRIWGRVSQTPQPSPSQEDWRQKKATNGRSLQ